MVAAAAAAAASGIWLSGVADVGKIRAVDRSGFALENIIVVGIGIRGVARRQRQPQQRHKKKQTCCCYDNWQVAGCTSSTSTSFTTIHRWRVPHGDGFAGGPLRLHRRQRKHKNILFLPFLACLSCLSNNGQSKLYGCLWKCMLSELNLAEGRCR